MKIDVNLYTALKLISLIPHDTTAGQKHRLLITNLLKEIKLIILDLLSDNHLG